MLILNICSFFPLVIPELQLESIFYYPFTGYKCWSNLYLPVLQCLSYKSKENRKQMLQYSHIKEKKRMTKYSEIEMVEIIQKMALPDYSRCILYQIMFTFVFNKNQL